MAMHDPPHPGGIVRRQCLEPLGLTMTRAAEGLGVTWEALSELLNGRIAGEVGQPVPPEPPTARGAPTARNPVIR